MRLAPENLHLQKLRETKADRRSFNKVKTSSRNWGVEGGGRGGNRVK